MTFVPKGWQTEEEKERRFVSSIKKEKYKAKKDKNGRSKERGHRY